MLRQLRLEYCNVEHGQLIVVLQLHFLSKNKKYCLPPLWNKKEKRKKSWAKQWMLKKSIPLQLLIVVANFAQTNKNMYLLEKKNRYFPSLSRGKNKFVFSNQHMVLFVWTNIDKKWPPLFLFFFSFTISSLLFQNVNCQ